MSTTNWNDETISTIQFQQRSTEFIGVKHSPVHTKHQIARMKQSPPVLRQSFKIYSQTLARISLILVSNNMFIKDKHRVLFDNVFMYYFWIIEMNNVIYLK